MTANPRFPVPPEWFTDAEKTEYRETPRYAETIVYAKRLADASSMIEFESFGQSGEGREEFDQKLNDPQFAGNSTARLNFFYERSPYWDSQRNVYPVGRLLAELTVGTAPVR